MLLWRFGRCRTAVAGANWPPIEQKGEHVVSASNEYIVVYYVYFIQVDTHNITATLSLLERLYIASSLSGIAHAKVNVNGW